MNSSKIPEAKNVNKQSYKDRGIYRSITIENFRLFDKLELDGLSRINLFFGSNNSGKTSLLEAVFTHICGRNFSLFESQVLLSRQNALTGSLDFGEKVKSIFKDSISIPYTFAISAEIDGDSTTYTLIS